MASTTAPTTPESAAPAMPSMRRAFTVPTKLTGDIRSRKSAHETEAQGAETLFAHSDARIVSFASLSTTSRSGSSSGHGRAQPEEEPMGTLPWTSSTETIVATGMGYTEYWNAEWRADLKL
ncbi:MAG: hypothetical protein LQ347_005069 [Umbilicaria vellea]|nr:MAG: hypothetical protein LQ347_005069 [Umbilicaria vellea]